MNIIRSIFILLIAVSSCVSFAGAQPVTGVWRGKVTRGSSLGTQTYKLEVKLVKTGDSLTGTSYYYASSNNYFRYSVKGFFGKTDNSVSWWDDQLIESHIPGIKIGNANSQPMLSTADFNCPGAGIMKLDGSTHPKNGGYAYDIHLDKYQHPDFPDEWDPVIENYFYGGADPQLIDSVGRIAFTKPQLPPRVVIATPPALPVVVPPVRSTEGIVYQPPKELKPEPDTIRTEVVEPAPPVVIATPPPAAAPVITPPATPEIDSQPLPAIVAQPLPALIKLPAVTPVVVPPPKPPVITAAPPLTAEEKFARRRNVLTNVIPVTGDSIEFRFYDNAEVDGDSISIFLNKKLLYTHIRLTEKAYTIKIPVKDLGTDNELVMVAENLGSIPPNTAYMEAWSGGKRYATRMESTELSSAMIRLKRE